MLVSSTADGPPGAGTALQMASGAVYSADGKVSNGMLNGTKGTLLLSKNGNEALTFVPDSVGSNKVVVLSTAKATELTDTTGTKYVMDNDTGVYYNGKESVWAGLLLAERGHLPDAVSGCRRRCGLCVRRRRRDHVQRGGHHL